MIDRGGYLYLVVVVRKDSGTIINQARSGTITEMRKRLTEWSNEYDRDRYAIDWTIVE